MLWASEVEVRSHVLDATVKLLKMWQKNSGIKAPTVLDVQCGMAELYGSLPPPFVYMGIDFEPVVIEKAQQVWPSANLLCGQLVGLEPYSYDIVVGRSIMDMMIPPGSGVWRLVIEAMFALAKHGVIVSYFDDRFTGSSSEKWTHAEVSAVFASPLMKEDAIVSEPDLCRTTVLIRTA